MTILGRGDLSPPRRYGHRGSRGRVLLVVLVVAGLAVAGWYGWQHLGDDSDSVSAAPTPCASTSRPPAPAALGAVKLHVLNGTKRVGLAARVAHQLHKRGAKVTRVGNTKNPAAETRVDHAAAVVAAALAVREQLAGPARLATAEGPVVLVIGKDFAGLATPADAATARHRDVAAAKASPPACASP